MYMPKISKARLVRVIHFERHVGELFEQIETQQVVEYLYILSVCPKGSTTPVLLVSAETSANTRKAMKDAGQPVLPMLCAFGEGGHDNYGLLEDCPDVSAFAARAVAIAEERLQDKQVEAKKGIVGRAWARIAGNKKAEAPPPRPMITGTRGSEQKVSLAMDQASALRDRLIGKYKVLKRCDVAPSVALSAKLPPTGLLRIVFYRCDGKDMSDGLVPAGDYATSQAASEAVLPALATNFLTGALFQRPEHACVFQCMLESGGVPWPMSGYSLEPTGTPHEALNECLGLVIAQYAQSGCGSFHVRPLELSAGDVPWCVYFLWSLEASLGDLGSSDLPVWGPWLEKAATLARDSSDAQLAGVWAGWYRHWLEKVSESARRSTTPGDAGTLLPWAQLAASKYQPEAAGPKI